MRMDPLKSYYMVAFVTNMDGTIDSGLEVPHVFEKASDAVEYARDDSNEYGGTAVVYKIIPIAQITRPPSEDDDDDF